MCEKEWEVLVFILLARFCKRMVLNMWGCVGNIIYKPALLSSGAKFAQRLELGALELRFVDIREVYYSRCNFC